MWKSNVKDLQSNDLLELLKKRTLAFATVNNARIASAGLCKPATYIATFLWRERDLSNF